MKTYIFTIQLSSGEIDNLEVIAGNCKEACSNIEGKIYSMIILPGELVRP